MEGIKSGAHEATLETDKTAAASKEAIQEESEGTKKLGDRKTGVAGVHARAKPPIPDPGRSCPSSFQPYNHRLVWCRGSHHDLDRALKTAQELLGGWQLPDFAEHTDGVTAAAEAYDKLKTAVAGADTEFNGAASAFERQSKAISAELEATKQLIEAQKQKAVADLDIQRATGQVSPGTYAARKAMVEQGANDATVQAEIDARNADLAAKKQEAAGLGPAIRHRSRQSWCHPAGSQ